VTTLVSKGFGVVSGQKKAGENLPGVIKEAITSYRLILRRKTPARPTTPVPNRKRADGSGVDVEPASEKLSTKL
jgi:hypothetical protein